MWQCFGASPSRLRHIRKHCYLVMLSKLLQPCFSRVGKLRSIVFLKKYIWETKKVPIIVFEWAEQEVKLPTKNVEHDPIFTPDIPLYHSGLQNKMAVQNCLTIY